MNKIMKIVIICLTVNKEILHNMSGPLKNLDVIAITKSRIKSICLTL